MIYLDHASATPLSEKARAAMEPYLSDQFFNPSSPYLPAKRVREAYEDAKSRIAHTIGAKGNDLVITSGATEATNLAFTVVGEHQVLVLETEHASVLNTAKKFHHDIVRVHEKTGLINLDDLKNKITDDTILISVSLANNELGIIQPLNEVAEIIEKIRENRLKNNNKLPLYLHSDASQAMNLVNINVARLKTDLLTLNAAKIYGPKGVGALYIAHRIKLSPITTGGGQERGLRSGTENVPGTMAFAVAAEEAKKHLESHRRTFENFKKIFKTTLSANSKIQPIFLGEKAEKHQLANFCPVSFSGIDAERIIYKLEDEEIYLSTGAACAASKGEKSHVLKAIGLSDEEIAGSLRVSFGALNDEAQIRLAAECIAAAINSEQERLLKS